MKITILGCGASGGVPLITGDWGVCDPMNPKNRRTRSAVLVQTQGKNILIDSSVDLRFQLLAAQVTRIDAVLYTHAHADHILGIDELRQMYIKYRTVIQAFADKPTADYLWHSFSYIFEETDPLYPSFLNLTEIAHEPFYIGDVKVTPFDQDHGLQRSLGFRIGDFAYSTDFKSIPENSLEKLKGLKLWILDCLRDEEHYTHIHTLGSFEYVNRVKPQRALLTHMAPNLDYARLKSRCPGGVEPAYDGLEITL